LKPNGKKFKFSFVLVTCTLPTRLIASSKMDIGKDNEAVVYCLVKKVMYHSRPKFKEALKQVICFSK